MASFLVLIFLMGSVQPAVAANPCVPPPPSMSAWWTFDEPAGPTANDIAGAVNNFGTHNGGATPVTGIVSNALCFDGINDFVVVTNHPEVNFIGSCTNNAESFTIDAWIRANTNGPSLQTLLDKRESSPRGYSVYLFNGRLGFQINDGTLGNYNSPSPDLRDGQWHFIAVTVARCGTNGNAGTFYVDGIVVSTFLDPRTGDLNNTANLQIGQRDPAFGANYYAGCMDELEIYKRALTPQEIQGIFNAGSAGKCKCVTPPSGMVAWWPLDETSGTTVADIVSGLNGTPSPGPIGPIATTNGPAPASLWFPVVTAGGPKVGGALYFWHQFDNRFVRVPHNNALTFATNDFSIDAWVFITQYNATELQPIVEKMQYSGTTPVRGYRFYLESGVLIFQVVGTSGIATTSVGLANQLSQGVWHHVAVTYQRPQSVNQFIMLYIDGVLAAINNLPNMGDLSNTSDLIMGGSILGSAINYLDIAIDELEIFNRALPQQDIQAVFNAGSAGKCKPPCSIVFTCATNKTVPCGTNWNFDAPTNIVDTCCTNYSLTFSTVTNSGPCPLVTTRTWLVSDACGNSNTCSQTVTVVDTTPPGFTNCPASTNLGCNPVSIPDCNPAVGATDNCGATTVGCARVDSTNGCARTRTLTYTAVDSCNNSNTCTHVITWTVDTTPPSVCPNPTEVVYSIGTTNDNFVGAEPAFPSAGLLARLMAAGVTHFKGFDDCTVNSHFAHTFTNLPSCIVEAHLSVRFKACGDISKNDSFGLGFTQPSGANVPGWGRYLGNGNSGGNGLFNTMWNPNTVGAITLDLSALPNASGAPTDLIPKLNLYGFLDLFMQDDSAIDYAVLSVKSCCCQSNIVLITPANQCCAVATYTLPPFSDNCGTVTAQCTPPSGTCFPVGTNLVECRANDSCGQTGRCFFKVIVLDTVRPVIISCPTNVIACQGNTNLGVMPNLISQVVATDNCTPSSQLTITQNPLPGTLVSGGNVIFTVTDGAGNSTTCTNVILVQRCCVPPPTGLVLWLPFDEVAGPAAFNAAGGNNGTLMNGTTRLAGEYVNRSLCFDGVDDFVGVPSYPAINPGTGDFTLDAWVKRDPASGTSVRIIVDKRALTGFNIGYSLSVSFGNLIMTLADATGTSNYRDTGTVPADNQWHFVAVSITRALTNGGRFYINGAPTGTFDPTGHPGSLNNTNTFRVGSSPVGGNIPWLGCIDEVEMFRRALKPQEISALYNSRVKGKCRPSCSLPWDRMICPGQTSVVVTAKICNTAPVAQTYNYFFHGLPPGPMCTFGGPTFFSPASGSITVGPNTCVSFPVTIGAPAGMPCGNIACYELVFSLAGTAEQYACEGSLYKPCIPFCATPVTNITTTVFDRTNLLSFTLTSSSSSPIDLTGARFTAFGPDMLPDAQFVSLNGLPPGVPWEVPPGLILPPNGQITLSVNATFVEYSPGAAFTILLEADTDGDGEFEPLASMELVNVIVGTDNILTISRDANGNVVLEWSAQGWVLQQADSVLGPWTDVAEATSPFVVATPLASAKYYRLKLPQ